MDWKTEFCPEFPAVLGQSEEVWAIPPFPTVTFSIPEKVLVPVCTEPPPPPGP
jgi:hypothetical protein